MEKGKYGYFDPAAREYIITNPKTPTPWINYLGDGVYGGIISNNGGGFSFDRDPRFKRVSRYRYNAVPEDQPGRYIYLKDMQNGSVWSATWQPVKETYDAYQCRHGMGYSVINLEKDGIASEVTYFVPLGEKFEIWRLKVQNKSSQKRLINLFSYAEFCFFDAAKDQQNVDWVQQIGQGVYEDGFIFWNAFMKTWDFTFMVSSMTPQSFDTNRDSFIGRYHDLKSPLAVENGACSNSISHRGNGAGCFCHSLELAPGSSEEVIYILGVTPEPGAAKNAVKPLLNPAAVDQMFAALKEHWQNYLSAYQAETPDADLNLMLNTWNPYQCKATFNWSRFVSLYQLGIDRGMGLRDSAQDILGVLQAIPTHARELLIRLLQCQFADGHGYHLFYPLTGEGSMGEAQGGKYNWYSDDHLWLIEATIAYLRETGDFDFLNQTIPYAENGGEGSVWEHLMKAIDFTAAHLGEHQIPLNGFADWNDALNLDRGKGRAESVWTGMLYSRVLTQMSELATRLGKNTEAQRFAGLFESIKKAINEHAWDGEWYLQAYDDDCVKVGSKTNEKEEKIYLNPQSWAVLSGIAPIDRAKVALKKAQEILGTEFGLVLLYPAYKAHRPDRGGVSTYPPGAKENAGIFVHTNPWFIIAQLLTGQHNEAYQNYRNILPSLKNAIPDRHEVEPYVYCQNILGKEHPLFGLARNSWLTGTAAWAYVAGTQYLLGIRPQFDGLLIEPHIPDTWNEFTVKRKFRGRELEIIFKETTKTSRSKIKLLLNGSPIESGNFIPMSKIETGNKHTVQVIYED
jgi:cellobiose phosphorylase